MVRSQKKSQPKNHVIYVVDTNLEFSIFSNDGLLCDLEILVPIEVKEDEGLAKRQEVLEQKQKDDQPNVVQEDGYKGLFYEECNQSVINYVNDGFKKDFGPPIYDEYEEDYLGVIPKQKQSAIEN